MSGCFSPLFFVWSIYSPCTYTHECPSLVPDRYIEAKLLLCFAAGGGLSLLASTTLKNRIDMYPPLFSLCRANARTPKEERRRGECVCVRDLPCVFSLLLRLHRRVKSETRCVTNANRQKSSASLFHVNLFGCSSSSSYSTFYNPLRSITAGWDSGSFFFRCRHRRLQSESNKWGGKQRRR